MRIGFIRVVLVAIAAYLSPVSYSWSLKSKAMKNFMLQSWLLVMPVYAGELPAATSKVEIKVSVNREPAKSLNIELYGQEAPESTKRFISWCSGENDIVSSGGNSFSYDGALVSSLVKDKEIKVGKFKAGSGKKLATSMSDSGKVSMSSIDLAEELVPPTSDVGALRSRYGSISLPRAGKTFAFILSPSDTTSTDFDRKNIVIGQVTNSEGLVAIERINNIPVSRDDVLSSKTVFSAAGKGFDPRAKLASVNRPLQRIEISDCSVLEEASLTTFLGGRK